MLSRRVPNKNRFELSGWLLRLHGGIESAGGFGEDGFDGFDVAGDVVVPVHQPWYGRHDW